MGNASFDLQQYMTKGVENIVKGALKATLSDPKESLFMAQYAVASREASKIRARLKEEAKNLAPEDAEREYLKNRLAELRKKNEDIVFVSFPGDEKTSGGCVLFERKETVEKFMND